MYCFSIWVSKDRRDFSCRAFFQFQSITKGLAYYTTEMWLLHFKTLIVNLPDCYNEN